METPNQAMSKLGMLTPQQDAEETGVLWVIPMGTGTHGTHALGPAATKDQLERGRHD